MSLNLSGKVVDDATFNSQSLPLKCNAPVKSDDELTEDGVLNLVKPKKEETKEDLKEDVKKEDTVEEVCPSKVEIKSEHSDDTVDQETDLRSEQTGKEVGTEEVEKPTKQNSTEDNDENKEKDSDAINGLKTTGLNVSFLFELLQLLYDVTKCEFESVASRPY